jgi:hypothetical protein
MPCPMTARSSCTQVLAEESPPLPLEDRALRGGWLLPVQAVPRRAPPIALRVDFNTSTGNFLGPERLSNLAEFIVDPGDRRHARAEILQNAGYAVLSASDIETALNLLAVQDCFVVIVLGEMFSAQVMKWLAEMMRKALIVPLVLVHSGGENREIPADAYVEAKAGPEAILKAVSAQLPPRTIQDSGGFLAKRKRVSFPYQMRRQFRFRIRQIH